MNAKKKAPAPAPKPKPSENKATDLAFDRKNYMLLIIGLVLLFLGFLLMIGGGSDDPNVFNEKIFSFRRITLAPILIIAGFVVEIFAIMKKPNK
jgi:hypothetical protein